MYTVVCFILGLSDFDYRGLVVNWSRGAAHATCVESIASWTLDPEQTFVVLQRSSLLLNCYYNKESLQEKRRQCWGGRGGACLEPVKLSSNSSSYSHKDQLLIIHVDLSGGEPRDVTLCWSLKGKAVLMHCSFSWNQDHTPWTSWHWLFILSGAYAAKISCK